MQIANARRKYLPHPGFYCWVEVHWRRGLVGVLVVLSFRFVGLPVGRSGGEDIVGDFFEGG